MRHFIVDITATQCAELLGFNRKTINSYYSLFRTCILWNQHIEFQKAIHWNIEVDESYFGARRVRWKRGRWASWKTIVFGIYQRWWAVYTEIVDDCTKKSLQQVIRWHISADSVIYSDWWPWYSWLVDVGYDKHLRVDHGKNEFSKWHWIHINGIEAYWSFCKRRLSKFNGVKVNFEYHLKECERRYGKSNKQLQESLLSLIKKFKSFI